MKHPFYCCQVCGDCVGVLGRFLIKIGVVEHTHYIDVRMRLYRQALDSIGISRYIGRINSDIYADKQLAYQVLKDYIEEIQ